MSLEDRRITMKNDLIDLNRTGTNDEARARKLSIEQPNSQDLTEERKWRDKRSDRRNTIRRANNCLGSAKITRVIARSGRCSASDLIFPIADKSFTCRHARRNSRQLRESIYFSWFHQVTGSRTRKGCSTLPASRITHIHTHTPESYSSSLHENTKISFYFQSVNSKMFDRTCYKSRGKATCFVFHRQKLINEMSCIFFFIQISIESNYVGGWFLVIINADNVKNCCINFLVWEIINNFARIQVARVVDWQEHGCKVATPMSFFFYLCWNCVSFSRSLGIWIKEKKEVESNGATQKSNLIIFVKMKGRKFCFICRMTNFVNLSSKWQDLIAREYFKLDCIFLNHFSNVLRN